MTICISCIFIGSVEGGVDIVDNHNVGVTNHMSFHNLQLQNGHKYFVTVKGNTSWLYHVHGYRPTIIELAFYR